MSDYNAKVFMNQGAGSLSVRAKDGGQVLGQSTASGSLAQAATIADVSVTTVAWTTGDKAKVNAVLTALENVGILATS